MGRTLTREEFPFVGPTNVAISPYIDAERSINLYYEPEYRGGKPALVGTPGLSAPTITLAGGIVRGLYADPALTALNVWTVAGNHVYQVFNAGASSTDFGAIPGAVGGATSPAHFYGGLARPMTLMLDESTSQFYFCNPVGPAVTSVLHANAGEFLDGFFFAIATGASLAGTNPNQISASAFNDGTTWPGLAFALKEGSNDQIFGLATVNNLMWVFGSQNIEVWYNAGLPNFPLARVNGGTMNVGAIGNFPAYSTIQKTQNSVIWLGASQRGFSQVYMADGLRPKRISTAAIEAIISTALISNTSATAFVYQEAGHEFYVLILSALTTALVYDITTGLWHERASNAGAGALALPFQNVATSMQTGIAGSIIFTNGATSGAIYKQNLAQTSDNGTAILRQRTAPHLSDGLRWIKYPEFQLHADIGTAQATLIYSNDGGKTFPALHRSDVTQSASSDAGGGSNTPTFGRFRWLQCGRSRKRAMGIKILDGSNSIVIADGLLRVSGGTEA